MSIARLGRLLIGLALLFASLGVNAALVMGTQEHVPLAGHMEMLIDADGTLDIAAVSQGAASRNFKMLAGDLAVGYLKGAVWLRVVLAQGQHGKNEWWLEVPTGTTDEVRLYQPGADGNYSVRTAGEQLPSRLRDIPYRNIVFRLTLPDDGPQTLYLRLQTSNAMVSNPKLWSPSAFIAHANREELIFGGIFTFLIVIGSICLLVGLTLRDPAAVSSGGFNLSLVVMALPIEGFLQQYLLPDHYALPDMMIGAGMALHIGFATEIFSHLGGFRRAHPRGDYLLRRANWLVVSLMLAISLLGHYTRIAAIAQLYAQLLSLAIVFFALGMAWRGNHDTRLYLIPYGGYTVFTMTRLWRNLGWMDASAITEYGWYAGAVFQAIGIGLIVAWNLRRMRIESEAASARELALSRQSERELEGRVAARTQELTQALSEQRQLLSMVSHEFRTPLAVIDGATQNIERGIAGDKATHQIRRAVGRLTQLLSNALAEDRLASHSWQAQRQQVDSIALIHEAIDGRPAGTASRIRTELPSDAPILADRNLLRIAIDNLLDNALKYAPAGDIDVRLNHGTVWQLTVADCGPGLPDDVDIFAKYARGNATVGKPGAGLGLFLVARIAELHGGKISAINRPGGGAEFTLELPSAPR